MANIGDNGDLVHVLTALLGELAAAREAREARMAEHEQRMTEWATIIARINVQQAALDTNIKDTAERVHALEEKERVVLASLRELTAFIQTVAVEIQALKGRVEVVEQRPS